MPGSTGVIKVRCLVQGIECIRGFVLTPGPDGCGSVVSLLFCPSRIGDVKRVAQDEVECKESGRCATWGSIRSCGSGAMFFIPAFPHRSGVRERCLPRNSSMQGAVGITRQMASKFPSRPGCRTQEPYVLHPFGGFKKHATKCPTSKRVMIHSHNCVQVDQISDSWSGYHNHMIHLVSVI